MRLACSCEETCESFWPTKASLYTSSTCLYLGILAAELPVPLCRAKKLPHAVDFLQFAVQHPHEVPKRLFLDHYKVLRAPRLFHMGVSDSPVPELHNTLTPPPPLKKTNKQTSGQQKPDKVSLFKYSYFVARFYSSLFLASYNAYFSTA